MTLREVVRLALQGGPGVCQVAVTNVCNAHCRFCSFPQVPPASRRMADTHRLLQGLAATKRRGIHYLIFTGGEPLLYPDLLTILAVCQDLALKTLLVTNGALLSPQLIQDLKKVGLDSLIISIDAANPEIHDRHRGLPGLTSHLTEILPVIHRTGLKTVASVTLSRLLEDLDALIDFLKNLGFTRVTFSYPLTQLDSSYLGFAPHTLVDFAPAELDQLLAEILSLKNRSPLIILNPRLALEDARRQLQGRPGRFPCLAGYKYFYADWNLEVYRCHFLPDTLGPMEDIDRFPPIRDGCKACNIDCYRDPSVYQFAAVSLADALTAWRQGKFLLGLKFLLHPYNFLSLASLLEGRYWV